MTFTQLSEVMQEPQPHYFELLLSNHIVIIAEVGKTSKTEVSKALNINPSQFSGIYSCIVAYDNLKSN